MSDLTRDALYDHLCANLFDGSDEGQIAMRKHILLENVCYEVMEWLSERSGPNEIMRAALQEIAAKAGMTLLGPEHDTERHHEIGAHKAFGDCALIAEVALKRFDATRDSEGKA